MLTSIDTTGIKGEIITELEEKRSGLATMIELITKTMSEMVFEDYGSIYTAARTPSGPVVYFYYDMETKEIVYIGYSEVGAGSRLTKVKNRFKCDTDGGHHGANKMFKEKPSLSSWGVKVVHCSSGDVARFCEKLLINKYSPRMNDEKMAGK